MDIVSSVRGLFPDVTAAVEQYRQTKDDRDVRNLARRLANEEALYDQFIRKLSLLPSPVSTKSGDVLLRNVKSSFGIATANNLKNDLHQMEEFLRALKSDLANTSRGTEVLAKFRRTRNLSRAIAPRNPLQKRLDDLSRVNKRLAAYLLHGQVPLALVRDFETKLDFMLWLPQQKDGPPSAFHIESENFASCACQPVLSKGTTQHNYQDWKEAVISLHHRYRHITIQCHEYNGEGAVRILNANTTLEGRDDRFYHSDLIQQDEDHNAFRLVVTAANLPQTATSFEDMILHNTFKFDQRRRMELAFQLSSAILLVWTSVSIPSSFRWKDWMVSFDPHQGSNLCSLYLSPLSHFSKVPLNEEKPYKTGIRNISQESVLTLLGLRLTELAFGRTLAEIREENADILRKESGDDGGDDDDNDNQSLSDLMIVKRLLTLHRIGEEFGPHFEDVVNICLTQQYRERKGAAITELDIQNESFLERAAVAILLPLYQEAHKYSGCTCNVSGTTSAKPEVIENETAQFAHNESQKSHKIPLAPAPVQPTPKSFRVPEPMANIEAFHMSDPLRDQYPLSQPPRDYASDGISSNSPALRSQKEVPVNSVNNFRGAHQSYDESIDRQHISTSESFAIESDNESKEKEEINQREASATKSTPGPGDISSSHANTLNRNQYHQEEPNQMMYPQQQDIDAATVCSYETIAGTTDSAFPWLSDHTDELPDIPENHPLLSFKGIALRILLIAFRAWRERGNGGNGTSLPVNQTEASKKRTRIEPENSQNDEVEDEEGAGGSSQGNLGFSNKKRRVKDDARTFSCPFFKKDSSNYGRCCQYILTRIRDVKQHLARCHNMPIYCPRCIRTFNSEDERDAHVRDIVCERAPLAMPEGITQFQRRQLAKKAPASQSLEDQWYGIFDLLFPGHTPRPQSPYIESGLLSNVVEFQSFSKTRGPRIISDVLNASQAVTWHPPNDEADVQAFQRHVLGDAIQAIFDEWTSLGGLASSESNTLDSSTRSLSRRNHQMTPAPQENIGYDAGDQYSATMSSDFTAPSSFVSSSESFQREGELLANLNITDGWDLPITAEDLQRMVLEGASLQHPHTEY